jgi:hypothetical protein
MTIRSSVLEYASEENSQQSERNEKRYECIGTLGDDTGLTCSMDAVKRWGKAGKIRGFESFEQAAESTKRGEIPAFVVPCAYPALHTFIMDAELTTAEIFIRRIPALVVVGTSPVPPKVDTVFHHPATEPLLAEIGIPFERHQPVSSNVKACEEAINTPGSLAITNMISAEHYNVQPIKILRQGIEMPWLCLKRR